MDKRENEKVTSSTITYRLLFSLIGSFVLGIVGREIWVNISAGTNVTFSTLGLIGFSMSVILSGASIFLAITAINLGKSSEKAIIDRNDESIRLQNAVFTKTTEALGRIESSTGVTEKRLEDIIAGRAGALSSSIADIKVGSKYALPPRDRKELEDKIKRSILKGMDPEEDEKLKIQQEKREAAQKEYEVFHENALNAFSNRDGLKAIKTEHGKSNAKGQDLFDGVYAHGQKFIGVSAFSYDMARGSILFEFLSRAAREISQGNFVQVFICIDTKKEHANKIETLLNSIMSSYRPEIIDSMHILTCDSKTIHEIVGELKLSFE